MKFHFTKTGFFLLGFMAFTSCASVGSSTADSTSTAATKTVVKEAKKKAVAQKKTVTKKATNSNYSKKIGKDKHGMATYSDSSRTRYVRATAYSHMENEPGAPGRKNAAGTILKYGNTRSVAADWSRLPLGTKFKIVGKPYTYVVDDYGSALAGTNTIDMFFPTLSGMRNWGTRKVTIKIIQMGSFERSAKLLKGRLHAAHCRKMYYAITKKRNKSVASN